MGVFRFGDFELDLAAGQLRRSGTLVKLPPQPFKVLALLASRAGQPVTREEIRTEIWGSDTFVDFEQGLNSCIKQIRHALGDARYIETLPKRGYRFVTTKGTQRWIWVAVAAAVLLCALCVFVVKHHSRVLVAVLPFEGDDTISEETIAQLARLEPGELGAIAWPAAKAYGPSGKSIAQIARELGVEYVVTGSVRSAGGRVRISAQLVEARRQSTLWSESYERDATQMLAVESVIARRIARSLGGEVLAHARPGFFPWSPARALDLRDRQQGVPSRLATANSQAFEAYLCGLQGLSLRNEEGFREALHCFRQAIQEDPHYALAYTGLADTYNLLGEYYLLPPAEAFPLAQEAARHALDIDDSLAEAHTSLAFATAKFEWDWPAAESGFRRALELNPDYATAHQWYAELLSGMGRHDQAIAEIGTARRLDPVSPIIQAVEGFIFYNARRYDQAITVCRAALARNPHFLPALHFLLLASERKGVGDIAAIRRAYAEAERSSPRSVSFKSLLESGPPFDPAPYSVAAGYASLGRKEQAFAWLDRAYERKDALLAFAKVDPNLDALRGDPRFANLLRRVGLEQ